MKTSAAEATRPIYPPINTQVLFKIVRNAAPSILYVLEWTSPILLSIFIGTVLRLNYYPDKSIFPGFLAFTLPIIYFFYMAVFLSNDAEIVEDTTLTPVTFILYLITTPIRFVKKTKQSMIDGLE